MIKVFSPNRVLYHGAMVVHEDAYLMGDFHGYYDKKASRVDFSPMCEETSSMASFASNLGMFGKPTGLVFSVQPSDFARVETQMKGQGYSRKTLWYQASDGTLDVCNFYVYELPFAYLNGPEKLLQESSNYVPLPAIYVDAEKWSFGGAFSYEIVSPVQFDRGPFDLKKGLIIYDNEIGLAILKNTLTL